MSEMKIIYAYDLDDSHWLLMRLRQEQYRLKLKCIFEKLEMEAEENLQRKREGNNASKEEEAIWNKIKNCIAALLFKKEPYFENDGEAMRQAIAWILNTISIGLISQENWRADENFFAEDNEIMYAGLGFGEFWAISYEMYRRGELTLWEVIYLAYQRGYAMENIGNQEFVKLKIDEKNEEWVNESIQKFHVIFPEEVQYLGRIKKRNGDTCYFGHKSAFEKIAEIAGRNPNTIPSIPYTSQYLFMAGNEFAKQFENQQLGPNVITEKEGNTLSEIIAKGFYERVDERRITRKLLDAARKRKSVSFRVVNLMI